MAFFYSSTITPRSGPNNINYVWKLDNEKFPIPAPYFSLRSVKVLGKPSTIYNIGWAIDSTTPASSFTFNPSTFIRSDDGKNPKPSDSAIPPLPGFYNLILNANSGGSNKDVVVGTIYLQDDTIVPKIGTATAPFRCLFSEKLEDKYNYYTICASYNNTSTPFVRDVANEIKFNIGEYTLTSNNLKFIPAMNNQLKSGTYTIYFYNANATPTTKVLGSYYQTTPVGDVVTVSGNSSSTYLDLPVVGNGATALFDKILLNNQNEPIMFEVTPYSVWNLDYRTGSNASNSSGTYYYVSLRLFEPFYDPSGVLQEKVIQENQHMVGAVLPDGHNISFWMADSYVYANNSPNSVFLTLSLLHTGNSLPISIYRNYTRIVGTKLYNYPQLDTFRVNV